MPYVSSRSLLAGVVTTVATASVHAQVIGPKIEHGPGQIRLQPIVTGLTAPVDMAFVPGDPTRFVVLEQPGQIKLVENGVVNPTLALDAASTTVPMRSGYDERGLLGVAFDPGFSNPSTPGYRRVFTWSSSTTLANPTYSLTTPGTIDHTNVLASYRMSTANPNMIDPSTRTVLFSANHPSFNHDAGSIKFGPDGYLYFGIGDGGGANDTGNGHNPTIGNARDLNSPLGKIHRIDVNGTNRGNYGIPADNPFAGGSVPEIYAYGFRNPYRFSFNGNRLLVADVGQNNVEEIDDVIKGGNYGWNLKEGTFRFNPANGSVSTDLSGLPTGLIDPLAQYDHDEGIAIVGGFIYTGSKVPALQGKYVFGDFGTSFATPSGRLFYADLATGKVNEFVMTPNDVPLGLFVKGMAQGPDGELYVLTSSTLAPTGTTGAIFQIVPEPMCVTAIGAAMVVLRRRR